MLPRETKKKEKLSEIWITQSEAKFEYQTYSKRLLESTVKINYNAHFSSYEFSPEKDEILVHILKFEVIIANKLMSIK